MVRALLCLLITLFSVSNCYAAWNQTNSQTGEGENENSIAATAFSSALTNPSIIVVSCIGSIPVVQAGSAFPAPTDTAGNTYEIAKAEGTILNGDYVIQTWYALNSHTTASNIVTCNYPSSSGVVGIIASEFTGGSTNDSPIDVAWYGPNRTSTSGSNNIASTCDPLTCNPKIAGDLIYAVFACGDTCTAGTSPITFATVNSGGFIGLAESYVNAGTSQILPTATDSNSGDHVAYEIVEFAPSGTSAFPLNEWREDKGNLSDNSSLGNGWTLRHTQSATTDDIVPSGDTIQTTLLTNPQVGDYLIASLDAYPTIGNAADLCFSDSLGNVAQGLVSTTGTSTVTFESGVPFSLQGCDTGTCNWVGKTVVINGTNYTISTVSLTSMTVSPTPPVLNNVKYIGPTPFCSLIVDTSGCDQGVGIAYVSNSGSDTVTETTAIGGQDDFSIGIDDIYNAAGILGIDTAGCLLLNANCSALAGTAPSGTFSQSFQPTQLNGEYIESLGCGVYGSIYSTNNTQVEVGSLNAGTQLGNSVNNYCAQSNSFCSNQIQRIGSVTTGSEELMQFNDNTSGDNIGIQSIGIMSGAVGTRRRVFVVQ